VGKKAGYTKIVVKISGEALCGSEKFGIDPKAAQALAEQLCEVKRLGCQAAVVIGGGNIIRGSQAKALKIPRAKVDEMGMIATTLNGMFLVEALEQLGTPATVCGAFSCGTFIPACAGSDTIELLENGITVVFVGGTGHPFFTTDTAAALRACEIGADAFIKATKVDGIFEQDPVKNPKAKRFEKLTYSQVLSGKLDVMDGAAVALCRDNNIPIHVLNIFKKGALKSAVQNRSGGSIITGV